MSVSCGVTASFSRVPVHTRFCLCPPRVCFPVLCKFWQLYGGVNDDLLQEGLCHTQVCCTQSPCPCGRPLLTCTSPGDAQTQFCLSLCGVSGSWCTQGLFEPSEHLWQEWSLILNAILPLLPSCWGLSALGHGVSPHSHFSATQPPLQHRAAALTAIFNLLAFPRISMNSVTWKQPRIHFQVLFNLQLPSTYYISLLFFSCMSCPLLYNYCIPQDAHTLQAKSE